MRDNRLDILSENIRSIRARKKISQDYIASVAKLSRRSVSAIENGWQKPNIFAVIDIARALDVELSDLLKGIV